MAPSSTRIRSASSDSSWSVLSVGVVKTIGPDWQVMGGVGAAWRRRMIEDGRQQRGWQVQDRDSPTEPADRRTALYYIIGRDMAV